MEEKWLNLTSLLLPLILLLLHTSSSSAEHTLSFPSSSSSVSHRKISPFRSNSDESTYAVIFDAGSSGSRLHVFHFDSQLELLFIGKDIEISDKIKPGLSSYADDPQKAADSLLPLLGKAEATVPPEFHPATPILLGATAGLRLLDEEKSEKILEAVRDLFERKSTFKYKEDGVTILTGNQEGSYMWVTVNYLLGNLGKKYSKTVGVVDLGGGSVQMAYAISADAAAQAPNLPQTQDSYVQQFYFRGTKYFLYVHSYLNYGLLAARAEILKITKNSSNPCMLGGYEGSYEYQGKEYKASGFPEGASFEWCRRVILKAMKVYKPCNYTAGCTFDGIWSGGGGDGHRNLYFASSFYEMAIRTGIIDSNKKVAGAQAADFKKVAELACSTKYADAKAVFPNYYANREQFACMDFLYMYSLLVHGFGVEPNKKITLVQQLEYHGSFVDVAWPLGDALAVVSKNDAAKFLYAKN